MDNNLNNEELKNEAAENQPAESGNVGEESQNVSNGLPPQYISPQNVYAQPPAKKRLSAGWIAAIVVLISVMMIIVVVLSVMVVKKIGEYDRTKEATGSSPLSDLKKTEVIDAPGISGNKEIVINLPVSDKPVVDVKFYEDEATGLLTTEGVAEFVLPSQVLIGIYNDTPYEMTSVGSGVILTADGFILTNAHVVDGAKQLKVTLNDGNQHEAEVVGIDKTSDIAIVKIDAGGLTAAQLGNSDSAVLGEEVAVVGAAGSFENSITFGHISALEREIETDYSSSGKLNCIQTDAALNPGNSGGALVNMYGQVIGLSVGGMAHSAYEGIGFAIEINDVIPIAEELMKNGFIKGRARVGVAYIPMTTELAAEYGVPVGICVAEIDETCDVAKKDIQIYDIITHIDGMHIYDAETIEKAMENKYAGQTVTLTVYRKTITEVETTFEVEIVLAQKYDKVTEG